jgi:hypothetical protein
MTRNVTLTALGLLATLAASSLTPALADGPRGQLQADKNTARNIGIAGAAVAVYGLLSHNSTATVIGAAGALIGGSQYEKDSQKQSRDNHWGDRYYRDDRNWNDSGRGRGNSGWGQGQGRDWDARTSNDGRQWNHDNHDNNRDRDRDSDARWDGDSHNHDH